MASLKNLIVLGSARFVNTIKGTIEKASQLATARTIQTNLASTSSASFDGTANITPGVTGTLAVGNGGTGATSLSSITVGNASTVNGLTVQTAVPSGAVFTDTNTCKSFFGICATEAATAAKVVTLSDSTGFSLVAGVVIGVKFTYTNTASSVTLNVNSSGAKSIWYNTGAYTSTSNAICGYASRVTYYMFDGTYWVFLNTGNNYQDSNTNYYQAICATAAATAAKTATATYYALRAGNILCVYMRYANSYAGAITFNPNSTGAKPIYINGAASSSSNYTLPAGSYIVYYDGTNYYFRTDGVLTASGLVDASGNTINGPSTTLSGTMTAGSNTITFTDSHITSTCRLEVFTDVFGVKVRDITQSSTTVTLKFYTRSSDLGVKLVVWDS